MINFEAAAAPEMIVALGLVIAWNASISWSIGGITEKWGFRTATIKDFKCFITDFSERDLLDQRFTITDEL